MKLMTLMISIMLLLPVSSSANPYTNERNIQNKIEVSDADKPLFDAIVNKETSSVKSLIAKGVNVNAKDKNEKTALMYAAETDNAEMVKSLIEAGAEVNVKDKSGKTALMYAAQKGSTDNVRILLDAKAEVNARDEDGRTALMYAAINGFGYKLQALLLADAEVNLKDKSGKTALMLAKEKENGTAVDILKNFGATE